MKKKVAFQGIPGSFSHITACALFGEGLEAVQTTRFKEIFEAVSSNRAEFGVVPLENALAGSVHENYHLLAKNDCSIIAEYYCPVQLHLLGYGSLEEINAVISHPKALEQCSNLLESNPILKASNLKVIVWSDTASAAQHVANLNDRTLAAIASIEAAKLYNLPVITQSAQNNPNNSTRFVVIAKQNNPIDNPTKSSIIATLKHRSGSLNEFLNEIAKADLNLTKIESSPIDGQPFAYLFHIDIECRPGQSQILLNTLQRLKAHTQTLRILGTYQSAKDCYRFADANQSNSL
jgi:prephenate dehydratase